MQLLSNNVLKSLPEHLGQTIWNVALVSSTCRGNKIEDPISFRDMKEKLKIQMWLQIQNGNLDQLKQYQVR